MEDPYDLLVTDINSATTKDEIPRHLGFSYLSVATHTENGHFKGPMSGKLWGVANKPMVIARVGTCIYNETKDSLVRSSDYNIHLLVNTTCPGTYLTRDVLMTLGFHDFTTDSYRVCINGYWYICKESNKHFASINILGMDFIMYYQCKLTIDGRSRKIQLDILPPSGNE